MVEEQEVVAVATWWMYALGATCCKAARLTSPRFTQIKSNQIEHSLAHGVFAQRMQRRVLRRHFLRHRASLDVVHDHEHLHDMSASDKQKTKLAVEAAEAVVTRTLPLVVSSRT